MCFDQTLFNAYGDYVDTHSINDICMKIWKTAYLKGDGDEIDELP
jgi:hypothetical protein